MEALDSVITMSMQLMSPLFLVPSRVLQSANGLIVHKLTWSALTVLMAICSFAVHAQTATPAKSQPLTSVTLNWTGAKDVLADEGKQLRLSFEGASHTGKYLYNPLLTIEAEPNETGAFQLRKCTYADLSKSELALVDTNIITASPLVEVLKGRSRADILTTVTVMPFRKYNGKFQRLTSYAYQWYKPASVANAKSGGGNNNQTLTSTQNWAPNSVFATGNWYKLAITQSGPYKLDANYFRTVLGINPASIDPRKIQVYGHGGSMLPGPNSVIRPGDIPQNAIHVAGEADGSFDGNDYVLFYGKGPQDITIDSANRRLGHRNNFYCDTAYYYLSIGDSPGLRIQTATVSGNPTTSINQTDALEVWERDQFNLLKSGREWYGDNYDFVLNRNYTINGDNIVPGSRVDVRIATLTTGLRCTGGTQHRSNFSISYNGAALGTITHNHNCPYNLAVLGFNATTGFSTTAQGPGAINLGFTYNKNGFSEAVGYLNWIQVQSRRTLSLSTGWQHILSFDAAASPSVRFNIGQASGGTVMFWDVQNTTMPVAYPVNIGQDSASVVVESGAIRNYLALRAESVPSPGFVGTQHNQDLHGMTVPDLVIITPGGFLQQAQRLADFRRQTEGLDVAVVTTSQIYTEYSSGKQDLVGIRDFLRSLYWKQSGKLKYVLLFGDCSFDYKNRVANNTNLIPTFESINSLNPINSYNSDDYIGMMDDNEGEWREWMLDRLDLGIGRLVVKNNNEARNIVDKLMSYANSRTNMGIWRTRMSMVADNGDGLLHFRDAQAVTAPFESQFAVFNVVKIYVSAYPTVASPLGSISPAARDALDRSVNQGSLMVNYAGHGNEFQWTSEQILTVDNFTRNWANPNNLPFFVTATCDFGRYDDPTLVSGGEQILLMPNRGGIGLVTTTRPVYANNNLLLNRNLTNSIFTKVNGAYPRLGDAQLQTKNRSIINVGVGQDDPGNRSFALLGDPSMRLAYPRYDIRVTQLTNGSGVRMDTLRALDQLRMQGEVVDGNGSVLSSFNGQLICTIYDKPVRINVVDEGFGGSYEVRNSIVYSGRATVRNGRFSLSFVTPLDINYVIGNGKVSLYAFDQDMLQDAAGFDLSLRIGGSNEVVIPDNDPPLVRMFMGDTTFQNGGLTGSNSAVVARISDDNGINLATSGIGREMLLRIDNDPNQQYVVNEFYQADPDTYKSGTLNFPISGLKPGKHFATLTVWDTHNNSATGRVDFRVAGEQGTVAVEDFRVFPNPVQGGDKVNFTFSHTLNGANVNTKIEIVDLAGRRVRELNWSSTEASARLGANGELEWDLKNADGQFVANAMYIARLTASAGSNQAKATFKVVIQR